MKKYIPTKEIIEDYKELTENKRELFQMLEDNGYDSMSLFMIIKLRKKLKRI